jgi:hypothetical protein
MAVMGAVLSVRSVAPADAGADKHTDWYLLQTIWYVFKKNDRLRQFVQTPTISTCCGQTS